MRNLTPATITKAFADYARKAPSASARATCWWASPVTCIGFVRENKVTQAEWSAGIDALTRAMKFTDDKRNEYILFSDLLGVSSLVDMVNAAKTRHAVVGARAVPHRGSARARATAATCGRARSASRWW